MVAGVGPYLPFLDFTGVPIPAQFRLWFEFSTGLLRVMNGLSTVDADFFYELSISGNNQPISTTTGNGLGDKLTLISNNIFYVSPDGLVDNTLSLTTTNSVTAKLVFNVIWPVFNTSVLNATVFFQSCLSPGRVMSVQASYQHLAPTILT